jgi:hypothetical protein
MRPLNHQQREAACHGDSPLLIVARAGMGKPSRIRARAPVVSQCHSLAETKKAGRPLWPEHEAVPGMVPAGGRVSREYLYSLA